MTDQPETENRVSAEGESTPSLPEPVAHEDTGLEEGESAQPADQPTDQLTGKADHTVERTRTSGMWTAIVVAAVVLLLLLIFILQNLQSATVAFFGFDGRLPLGVALLLAAVAGALLVVVIGMARIIQLRRVAKRHRRHDNGG